MMAVKLMVDRLSGVSSPGPTPVPNPPPPQSFCGTDSNADHVAEGRAHAFFYFVYLANGSNDFLGLSGSTQTTLKEVSPGTYKQVSSCP